MVQYLLSNLCSSEVIDVGIGPPKGVMSLQHRELWGRGFWTFIHNIKIYKDHKVYNNDEVSPEKKYIPCIDCAVMFVNDQEVLGLRMLYRYRYRDISPTKLNQNWDLNQVKC